MQETLKRICSLQSQYSSSNTPEMQERGSLIRGALTQAISARLPRLQMAFDGVFDDLDVVGSDGIGRKTEAPWVRLFSKTMSPNPREGFYVVLHFSADGSAVFVTVGCGSTVWSGGDLRPVSDDELLRRTSWARSVIEQRWQTIAPFTDEISLGARAPLPRTFEKATAVALRIPVDNLDTSDLDGILYGACERLGEIYLAQLDQRDVSQGDQDANDVVAIARPLKVQRNRQGMGLTGPERKAVELRAMLLAVEYLTSNGYQCKDTSSTESFDLMATSAGVSIKVEVKGTTSDLCDSVMMTKNEVELHKNEKGKTGLIIVSKIKLNRDPASPTATGGSVESLLGWDIDQWVTEPIAFQVSRH